MGKFSAVILGAFLPARKTLKELDVVRDYRNEYVHEDREVTRIEGRFYIERVASVLGSIHDRLGNIRRAVVIEAENDKIKLWTRQGSMEIKGKGSRGPMLHLDVGCCIYIHHKDDSFRIVHAMFLCNECRKVTYLDSVNADGSHMCPEGDHKVALGNMWHSMIRSSKKAPLA